MFFKKAETPLVKRAPVISWIGLLFVLTVLCLLPYIIGRVGLLDLGRIQQSSLSLFILCMTGLTLLGFTPTLAARIVGGPVMRQIKNGRVGFGWYTLAIIGPIGLFLLADLIHLFRGSTLPEPWLSFPSVSDLGSGGLLWFIARLILGSVGEEPGWRGFAQPRLQERYGALRASILVGIIWSTWHSWPLITPHSPMTLTDTLVVTYLRITATAVIYAWMYNSTKGSLLLVMVAHAGHNIAGTVFPTAADGPVIISLLYLAVAIVVILMTDPRTLIYSNRNPAGPNQEKA
jgi:membrane protease YdiL (CAAX protease family)